MNKVVYSIPLVAFMIAIAVSVLVHLQGYSRDVNQRGSNQAQVSELAANNWVATLEALPQYKKPVVAKRTTNNKPKPQQRAKPQPPREPQVHDAVLIGVVYGEDKQAILVNKKPGSLPIYLREGESWLSGWKIETINIDRLVWVNPETSEKQTQFLFGKS